MYICVWKRAALPWKPPAGATDFGSARLRVTADQVRHVAEGRSLYVGNGNDARPGDYISLTLENDVPRRATVTGGGAVR
ncbi:MAG TPA: hypothetical protein DD422_01375 [Akkermansia sp.]|nr:hypothetical protein [Akkermansia sp.]